MSCRTLGAAVASLTTAPIGGTFMEPEAKPRVDWTNVSTNTKVCGLDTSAMSGACYPIPRASNAAVSPIPSSNCRVGCRLKEFELSLRTVRPPSATLHSPTGQRVGRRKTSASEARTNRNEEKSARNQPCLEAEWQWVCGMPGVGGWLVVSSPPLCGVRAHRLLRQFSEPACIKACGGNGASDHRQLRAG
jgi:hypothetical protein